MLEIVPPQYAFHNDRTELNYGVLCVWGSGTGQPHMGFDPGYACVSTTKPGPDCSTHWALRGPPGMLAWFRPAPVTMSLIDRFPDNDAG